MIQRLQAGLMAIVCALALFGSPADAQSASYSRIDVAGNVRVSADAVRAIADIQPGEVVTPADLNAALRRLFASGLFELVELRPDGGRLVIDVVENPTINFINFEGNRRIDDDVLRSIITLRERRAFSVAQAEADAARIVEAYRQAGRLNARVTPRIIEQADNRVDLVFEVFEGRVTEVSRISFVGNRAFSDRRLRRVVTTRERNILSTFFRDDVYDADRLELDKQLLREFYLNRGYVDFQILSSTAELSPERDGFFVSFNVQEGQQYQFGQVDVVTFEPELDIARFEPLIDLREGQTYSAERVDRVIERLAFEAARSGFAFVEIAPRVVKNEAARTIDIEFELLEGPRVFVERIDIEGNTQTLDRVIRREFTVVEGDAFNSGEVRRAEDRIRALGYFSTVAVRVREGSAADRAVIDVDVEDQPTGALSFGVAFSTGSGTAGTINLTERNFLGRGQQLAFDVSAGSDEQIYTFSFTEPKLFDRDLLAGFRVFYIERERDESSFSQTSFGITPRIGFPVSENGRLTLRYEIASDDISDIPDDSSDLIANDEGERITSLIGVTYTFDARNSRVDPTAGFIFEVDQAFAGLGGDQQYSRTQASARVFQSLFNEDVILSAEIEGGALVSFGDDSRIVDRFFLGGNSFRGFEFGGIGPRDLTVNRNGEQVDDAVGGNLFAIARFEASFPLGLPEELGIFGGVFYDIGTVWSLDSVSVTGGTVDDSASLRSAVGFSIFWETAIGPLRFNFARPIQKEDFDEEEEFRFTLGARF